MRELFTVASASLYPIRYVALCSPLLAYAAGADFAMLSVALSCDVDDPHTTLTMKLTNSGFVSSSTSSSTSSSSTSTSLLSQIVRFDSDGLPTDCIDSARLRLGRTFDKLLTLAQSSPSTLTSTTGATNSTGADASSNDARRVVGTILGPVDCLVHQCTLSNDDDNDDVDDDDIVVDSENNSNNNNNKLDNNQSTPKKQLSLICTPHLMIYRQFDLNSNTSLTDSHDVAVVNSIQVFLCLLWCGLIF